MHFIAFTCKEWKPNSLGRYGINSSASKTCFVTAIFAHILRLIIQNRFHLLLKYFSIRNSLSDVPSAPLFVDAVSIFVACAVEFQVGVLAPEDFSVSNLPLWGLTIRRSCVCCSVCMRNGLRFTDSKHCFADDEKTALHEYFGHWWEFEITFSRMLPRNKNAPWRQLLYDVMADTIGYICCGSIILGLNFISLCFKLIIIRYHTQKQREIKHKPRIKLNHNMYK